MSWQDEAIPGAAPAAAPAGGGGGVSGAMTSDNLGTPPPPVKIDKSERSVKLAMAGTSDEQSRDASLEALPGVKSEYDSEVANLKPPRSPAEAQAQADLRASAPSPGAAPAATAAPTWMSHAVPTPPAPAPPPPEPTITDKVKGGIEAGISIVTGLTTGQIGGAAGFLGGIAGGISTAVRRQSEGVPQDAEQQVAKMTGKPVGDDLQRSYSEGVQGGTFPTTSPLSQGYAENVNEALGNVLPLAGHMGELGRVHAAAAPVVQAGGDVARAGGAAVSKAVTPLVGAAGRAVLHVDPELAKVAQVAHALPYPISVAPDQVVANAKFSKIAGQAARDVPLSGSKTEPNQVAFTRNAISLINPDETADRLTPEIYADAMNRSGQGIGDIAAKTPVPLEDINAQLETLRDHVNAKHSDETTKPINAYIDELQAKADDNGMIDGTALKNINSEIGERARQEADKPLGGQLNDLQSIIQDGVEKNIADPADLKALKDYRRQYAYGKLLQPTVAKTITGLVSPASLMQAVTRTNLGKSLMANAKGGPIGDLAKVGQLIKEPGSSLTTERGLVYGAGLGAAYVEPHTLAAAYGAANIYNRAGPKLTRAMVGKRAAPVVEPPPGPPPEPTTSPGAGGGGGGAPPAGPGPLGDLTPEWGTTPGAGGGPPRGGHEPGLVPTPGENPPMRPGPGGVDLRGRRTVTPEGPQQPGPVTPAAPLVASEARRAGAEIPAVPGRPDLPEAAVTGGPAESAATERANAAMNEPGAIEARRQQTAEPEAKPEAAHAPAQGPSIAEAQRMLGENPSPETRKVLEDHIAAAKQTQNERATQEGQDAKAAQLERTARETTDPVIQKKLLDEADKLRGTERIPVGKTTEGQPEIKAGAPTKPLPVGKAIEGEPAAEKVPVGKATEHVMTPEQETAWRKQFGLGGEDAQRAKDVAQALKHDSKAVEAAAVQHEKSPRAFDRAISDINEKGEARANEAKSAAEGGEGNPDNAGTAGTAGAPVRPGEGTEGVRGGTDTNGGSTRGEAGAGDNAVPAAAAGAGGNAEPEPAAAVRGAGQQPGAERVPEAGRGGVSAAGEGGQGAGSKEGSDAARLSSAQWRDEGKTPAQLLDDKVRGPATDLAHQIAEEAKQQDFKPSELPAAVRSWATDARVPADDLRQAVMKALDKTDISDARKAQALKALDPTKGKPNDTANQPSDAGDLRGAGQEAKGPLEDEAFKGGEEPDQNGVGKTEAGLGQVAPTPFGNAKAMDKFIREQGGDKLIDGLRNRGLLKYSNSVAEGNPKAGAIMRQPNYPDLENHENTAATLYYDKLHEGNVMGVLMHELGEHFGIERVLGTSRYLAMLSDLKGLKDTPEVAEAWAHVEKNYVGSDTLTKYESMDNVNALREVAARLVETHPDLPFVRRLISEIRAFFYEHFGTTLGNTVDADLIRGLAASALRKAGEGKLIGQKPLARGTAPPAPKPFVPPKVTPRSDGFPPLYQ